MQLLRKEITLKTIYVLALQAVVVFGLIGCASTKNHKKTGSATTGNEKQDSVETATAFVVVAPDRGFWGNQQLRDTVSALDSPTNVVFIGDKATKSRLSEAIDSHVKSGHKKIVVLPYFLSEHRPESVRFRKSLNNIEAAADVELLTATSFGQSYLSAQILRSKLVGIDKPRDKDLILVGYGVTTDKERRQLEKQLGKTFRKTTGVPQFNTTAFIGWHHSDATAKKLRKANQGRLMRAIANAENPVVVPFELGSKLDGMMQFDRILQHRTQGKAPIHSVDIVTHANTKTWLQKEVNRYRANSDGDVGVLVLAHGSDFGWNETLRDATRPIHDKYKVEYAFTMADRQVIAEGLERLEQRGARVAIVVRVFGLASSFRTKVRMLLGKQANPENLTMKGPHGGSATPIPTPLATTTVGGLEDHALFARALADRIRELSTDPDNETVLLAAHGIGNDKRNRHWISVLESLRKQIRGELEHNFRTFKVGTWREDWPSKRKKSLPRMRKIVKEAKQKGHTAIVIPARTNGQGPAKHLLKNHDFKHGTGFAPHALFSEWVDSQVLKGLQSFPGFEN